MPGVAVKFSLIDGNDTGFDAATDEQGAFFAGAMSGGGEYSVEIYYTQPPLKPAHGDSFPTVQLKDGSSRVDGPSSAAPPGSFDGLILPPRRPR